MKFAGLQLHPLLILFKQEVLWFFFFFISFGTLSAFLAFSTLWDDFALFCFLERYLPLGTECILHSFWMNILAGLCYTLLGSVILFIFLKDVVFLFNFLLVVVLSWLKFFNAGLFSLFVSLTMLWLFIVTLSLFSSCCGLGLCVLGLGVSGFLKKSIGRFHLVSLLRLCVF